MIDLLHDIMSKHPLNVTSKVLKTNTIHTPLGEMVAMADNSALWLLEFRDRKNINSVLENIRNKYSVEFEKGENSILSNAEKELDSYFAGMISDFKTPIQIFGTDFQKSVWQELLRINFGETKSYSDIARSISKPSAYRAVANANASNHIAIIVPCHRVIGVDQSLAGYAGGIERKRWLIEHEKKFHTK